MIKDDTEDPSKAQSRLRLSTESAVRAKESRAFASLVLVTLTRHSMLGLFLAVKIYEPFLLS